MAMKTLDPQITLKLLEGHEDILTPMAEEREKFYQGQICPSCGGNDFTKVGDSKTMIRDGDCLTRYLLKCNNCECLFDPHSGIQLTMGNLGKAYIPAVPILDGPED